MSKAAITRRDLFERAAFGGLAFAFVPDLAQATPESAPFAYEVTRSDSEWRERLSAE